MLALFAINRISSKDQALQQFLEKPLARPVERPGVLARSKLNQAVSDEQALPSRGKPCGQALGQVRGQDFFLRYPQIVRDAIVSHNPGFTVEHGEGGTPIAVARLPDRPR